MFRSHFSLPPTSQGMEPQQELGRGVKVPDILSTGVPSHLEQLARNLPPLVTQPLQAPPAGLLMPGVKEGELKPEVRSRLMGDTEGKLFLKLFEKDQISIPPAQTRLRFFHEFGMFAKGGLEPFGPEHFVTQSDMFNGTYVRMLGNNQPPVGRALPRVLADLLSNRTKPKFSGLATDWVDFEKEWGQVPGYVSTGIRRSSERSHFARPAH